MPRWPAKILRHPFRSLAPVALFALAPKCAVCVLAYAGVGALLGIRGSQLCGATGGPMDSWAASLALFGVSLGAVGWLAALRQRRSAKRSRAS
jgi:hypothetical protein